jgi:hypothetical protein
MTSRSDTLPGERLKPLPAGGVYSEPGGVNRFARTPTRSLCWSKYPALVPRTRAIAILPIPQVASDPVSTHPIWRANHDEDND